MKYLVSGSTTHMCLRSGSVEGLSKGSVIRHTETVAGKKERKMKLIDVEKYYDQETPTRYEPFGTFWADCVTGTLYDPKTGKCLSSDQIWMVI